MSYGVALRNGVPFTLGTIAALCVNATSQWSPLALWPNGVDSPGMWIDPSLLTASFNDYTGTTPVAVPGTVADSANPVGLALDIRAGAPGAPGTLGPELVVNGDFSDGTTGWAGSGGGAVSNTGGQLIVTSAVTFGVGTSAISTVVGASYKVLFSVATGTSDKVYFQVAPTLGAAPIYEYQTPSGVLDALQAVFVATSTTTYLKVVNNSAGSVIADNISVREIPGNHMLQATSAARPLESARVNLLTKTELPGGLTDWGTVGGAVTAATLTGWRNGITSGAAFAPNAGFAYLFCDSSVYAAIAGVQYVFSCDVRMDDGGAPVFSATRSLNDFDIFIAADMVPTANRTITHLGDGIYRVSGQMVAGAGTPGNNGIFVDSVGSASGRGFKATAFQLERGITATDYQRVNTDSDYDATGITPFQLYDGTDDGMATASFAAGTLINGMDCMIAVRRYSGANCVAGLYNGIADATKFFGMAESASGSGCVGSGAGAPTVWVDNTQLTGGTAVTRGTLHTALTAGSYHILEFRNLDLSAWTATGFGLYTSYVFPGARGDIMLFESTASTADKDAARQYLADKYGVTLA